MAHIDNLHGVSLIRAHEHKHTVPRVIRQGINKAVDTYKGRNEHHEHRLRRENHSNAEGLQPDIQVVSVSFPDHLGRMYHFSYVDDVCLSDLREEILQNPRAPLAPECDQLYRFFPHQDHEERNNEAGWLDENSVLREIHQHLDFRRLSREQAAQLELEDVFVYVKNPSSSEPLLLRLTPDVNQADICQILCERMNIPEIAATSYDIFRACGSAIGEKPLAQLEELEFRRRNHFLISYAELSHEPPKHRNLLELAGDVTVREAVTKMIEWLGLPDATCHSVGLLWKSPSLLLEFDPPIMHWLPLDRKLRTFQFRPHEEIILQSIPQLFDHNKECSRNSIDIQQTLLFVTTPEVEKTVILATPGSFIKPRRVDLLNNEKILKTVSGVCQLQQHSLGAVEKRPRIKGMLYITSYRLLLDAANDNPDHAILSSVVSAIPLAHISSLQYDKENVLHVEMKNESQALFACEEAKDDLLRDIETLAFTSVKYCFAFQYNERFLASTDGWQVFHYRTEMARQGVTDGLWRFYENHNFEISPTYPYEFAIPAAVTDNHLLLSASYRSKNRVPVLSYLHHNGASICRCAQPKKGMTLKCCRDDEFLVNSIRLAAGTEATLWVIDCRAKSKATIQRVLDGGYERNYDNCEVYFCNIQNMHAMRHSMQRLVNACNGNCESFLESIIESKWLSHCFTILHAAQKTAQLVHSGSPVLVHCTDGWDRTPQICSLAQILLDPFFRTLEGFQVLIEKDWVSFGHKFGDRLGQGPSSSGLSERSPIFAQFLDCVWQLKIQFPHEFEFNDSFLHTVRYHSTSCRFGTFLFRNDRERRHYRLKKRTISLWTFINNNLQAYRNPTYNPVISYMQPHVAERALSIWREAYCFQSEYAVRFRYNKILQDVENLELKQENELLKTRLRRAEGMLYSRVGRKESIGARPRKGETVIPKVEIKPSTRDSSGRLLSVLDEADIGEYGGDVFLSDEEDDLYRDSEEEDLDNDTSISERAERKMDMGSA